jgi:hypothetical protein
MQSNAAASHSGTNCLLVGQKIISDEKIEYADVQKFVCGKKGTVRGF